jgi:Ca2+-binding EF-hand superfamily protein
MLAVFVFSLWLAPTGRGDDRPAETESAAVTPPDRDTHDLIFLGSRPVFVRIRMQVDGRSLREVRNLLSADLLKINDRDGDGFIDREEAKQVPPFNAAGGRSRTLLDDWPSVDRDEPTDKISKEELAAYFDLLMGPPFALVAKPERATQGVDLFSKFDADEDGKLSLTELKSAPEMIRKLDIDDDETFIIDELRPFQNPFAAADPESSGETDAGVPFVTIGDSGEQAALIKRLLALYDNSHDGQLDAAELGLPPAALAPFDADGNGALNYTEMAKLLQAPPAQLEFELALFQRRPGRTSLKVARDDLHAVSENESRPDRFSTVVNGLEVEWRARSTRTAVSDNRSFYKLEFLKADRDKNKYLDEMEFGAIGLPGADFKMVDRDSDGMVTEAEVLAFVDQDSASAQSRILMTVGHEGKSLFELLDVNLDRRLTRRELIEGAGRLSALDRDGDGYLTPAELTGRFRVMFEVGKPALFAPGAAANRADMTAPILSNAPAGGPEWFRKMDRNRDGDLSRREFLGPAHLFDKLDANRDGLISRSEAESN